MYIRRLIPRNFAELAEAVPICDFQQCGILTSVDSDEPVQPHFNLRNSKWCSAYNIQATSKGSDQSARITHH